MQILIMGFMLLQAELLNPQELGLIAAKITIAGTGGDGTSNNYGVLVNNAGSKITSVDGDIDVTGTGGNGSGGSNYGAFVNGGGVIDQQEQE